MRLFIGELLKQLNEKFPEYVTVGDLRESINDIDGTIHEAKRRGLIVYPKYKSVFEIQDTITISIEGFKLLNQILIEETLEKLDKSVQKFETSNSNSSKNIETAIGNLNDSIKKFNESSDKSSRVIIFLTMVLVAFTILLIFLTPGTSILNSSIIMVLLIVIVFIGLKFYLKPGYCPDSSVKCP